MQAQGLTEIARHLASKGRKGDDSIVHVTTGETIIPEKILNKNPKLKQGIQEAFASEMIDPDQFVVGSGIMSINPETQLAEFGIGTEFKKLIRKAGPIIGTVVGAMLGGPVGASIGAGIGSKTSNLDDRDIARNMALAFTASNVAQGAGVGGAAGAAGEAASAAGGWSSPFAAAQAGIGAFMNPVNYAPMASGQAGVGGFFQDIGSGAARSMGLGGTQTLVDAGLSKSQADLVTSEMARSGVDAATAAQNLMDAGKLAIDPSIAGQTMANLATAGPGISRSLASGYSGLNPLQQYGVRTATDLAMGLHQDMGRGGYSGNDMQVPSYFTQGLRSGPAIQNSPVTGGTSTMLPPIDTGMSMNGIAPNMRTSMSMSKNDILLDRLADSLLKRQQVNTPFPEFSTQTMPEELMAANGGFVGSARPMFMGGGYVQGPGGEKEDLINAKLSNNEFVMTADAVRGAGNGSIEEGADKMYELMNTFERRG